LKFYKGVTATTGGTAVAAGSCTFADGNNMGLCVSGGVTATAAATGSAYDYNLGTLVTLGIAANTVYTANCLAYMSTAGGGGTSLGFCVQCL